MSNHNYPNIAIGCQLSKCPQVITLGVCPNLNDYPEDRIELIRNSSKIYFPTSLYAEIFVTMGKEIFPSIGSYRFVGDKIKQTILFQLTGLPVPFTKFYYGPIQQKKILSDFSFPFVAKAARNSSRGYGVWLINNSQELDTYLEHNQPAYIQEFLPASKDYRVVIVGDEAVHAYERIPVQNEFRANVSQGGKVKLGSVPENILRLALKASRICGFNYAGLDICESKGKLYIIEANMKFGTSGFKKAGLDLKRILCQIFEKNKI
ncbi:MAG: RimK family alpha-L-glutamate ligase [Desulfonatronovibrio sp.]